MFTREKYLKKDIAVDVSRRHIDRSNKSDLFWMNDDALIEDTLLIKNMESTLIGDALKIPSIGYGLRMLVKPGEKHFLFDKRICKIFLYTFINCLQFIKVIFNKPEGYLLLSCIYKVFICKAIFNAYSIKLFISTNSFGNAAPLLACSMLNIVYLRGTWSNQGCSHPHIATLADVFFAWGDVTVNTYSKFAAKGTTFVKTGFIDGNLLENQTLIKKTDRISNVLDRQVVLGFFDNLSSYDHQNTVSDLRQCFLLLCELLDENNNLRILYKPKSGDLSEIHRTNTYSKLLEYIEHNRFIVFYGEKNYSNRPGEIATEMDIVLGFPISSAATETAISGIPSFHVDLTGTLEHPWEHDINNKFIFHKIDEAKLKLSNYIFDPELLKELSINYLQSVNHFNDFRAKERMQVYVEALCHKDALTVAERVSYANKVYINKFCKSNNCIYMH